MYMSCRYEIFYFFLFYFDTTAFFVCFTILIIALTDLNEFFFFRLNSEFPAELLF